MLALPPNSSAFKSLLTPRPNTPVSHVDISIPRTVPIGTATSPDPMDKNGCNASELTSPKEVSPVDKTVINMVVTDHFFPEVKFAIKDSDLGWDEDPDSFCQFFLAKCHVPVYVDRKDWWIQARKTVTFTLSQTRNDRNTAVKNAFVGTYEPLASLNLSIDLTPAVYPVTQI